MHDLVVKNGLVVDGTGAPAFEGEVAIQGDRIAAVGRPGTLGPARRELDAGGKLVTPGFVDIHTHYDAQVSWDPFLTPSSWHGCTTVVMGSCGVGFAPARPDRRGWLIQLMEGVEDIPGAAMHEGIRWEWESFPEYLDAIARQPHVIDFANLVPHGPVRAYVMGDRGAANEDATADDIAQMAQIVRDGMRAGALGFSTSRTPIHKASDGEFVPGTFAKREELFGLGRALGPSGVFHLALDHTAVPREFEWMRELARETGRTVSFNLSQTDAAPTLWREVLGLLEGAAADGLPIFGQVAGRAIGICMSLEATAHPFALHPSYLELADKPVAERIEAMRDPALRAKLLSEEPFDMGEFPRFITRTFNKMYVMRPDNDYEPRFEESLEHLARAKGVTPLELAYELLLAGGMLYFPLFNFSNGDLEVLRELHLHPRTRMGLSDAGAHCGAICDGGMPTFMLTHWARDRRRGERMPLEHLVHRQTRQTAEFFGLTDRGVLAPGLKGDLNVIDLERLSLTPAQMIHDLPAGGRRLMQRARGYEATICSGVIVLERDE
ncbi:MAG: amidohydrolase family protein, partial [Deltaproteobacteria bacterium]|nr:amidohydrolase family protein [Deltaproteobacteria bacterium]